MGLGPLVGGLGVGVGVDDVMIELGGMSGVEKMEMRNLKGEQEARTGESSCEFQALISYRKFPVSQVRLFQNSNCIPNAATHRPSSPEDFRAHQPQNPNAEWLFLLIREAGLCTHDSCTISTIHLHP